jgi:hypothetical protein
MKRTTSLRSKWKVIFTLAVFLFAASAAFAQEENLEETLEKLSKSAAQAYIAPFVSAFGSNLNGGWFSRAPAPKKFGFDLEFGLVGTGTLLPDEPEFRHFNTSGSFRFDQSQARTIVTNTVGLALPPQVEDALVNQITQQDFTVGIEGATIFGASDDNILISFGGGDITFTDPITLLPRTETVDPYTVNLGLAGLGDFVADIGVFPLVAPQASIGTILGTKATFRYLPEIDIPVGDFSEEIGKLSWFGWGVQHNPGVFFSSPLPVDISICYYSQNIKLGDIFEAKGTAWGLTASKKLGIPFISITPYAGFLIEKSSMEFTYDFTLDAGTMYQQEISIDFYMEGENTSRITAGLALKIFMFDIYADFNFGNYDSVRFGLMFGI